MNHDKAAKLARLVEEFEPEVYGDFVMGIKETIIQTAITLPTNTIDCKIQQDNMAYANSAAHFIESLIVLLESP